MDLRKIKKLIELVEESGITELEVRSGEEAVRIARPVSVGSVVRPSAVPQVSSNTAQRSYREVCSPLQGVFYRAGAPDAPPFTDIGDAVDAGQVVCIIESMKMMHEVATEFGGKVIAVLVDDGAPVNTGQPLFRIE